MGFARIIRLLFFSILAQKLDPTFENICTFMQFLRMTLCSSDSSLTTTSHTMTACPTIPNMSQSSGATTEPRLLEILAPHNRHLFLTPISAFTELSLELAKIILDRSAENLINAQLKRVSEMKVQKKRKFNSRKSETEKVLKIKKIYTQGLAIENVWEQARRVIDALREDVDKCFQEAEQTGINRTEEKIVKLDPSNDDIDDQFSSKSLDDELMNIP
ncbi:hypothetical protein HI914_03538 [Erysiphe necator]|nr:hypothetical protein HI914_03538 [Erysiphe necator]